MCKHNLDYGTEQISIDDKEKLIDDASCFCESSAVIIIKNSVFARIFANIYKSAKKIKMLIKKKDLFPSKII